MSSEEGLEEAVTGGEDNAVEGRSGWTADKQVQD